MNSTVCLFAKVPRPGSVKTRLTPPLSALEASQVAAAFYSDSLSLLRRVNADRRIVAFAPRDGERELREIGEDGFEFEAQADGDLGNRMAAVLRRAFESGSGRVILIGADSPTLRPSIVDEALAALKTKDVVLGPSFDLGYYMIGVRRHVPRLFEDMSWGTSEVLPATLKVIETEGLSLHLLPPSYDVDTLPDLQFLRSHVIALRLAGKSYPKATATVLDGLTILE